jgi:hypothetical protein
MAAPMRPSPAYIGDGTFPLRIPGLHVPWCPDQNTACASLFRIRNSLQNFLVNFAKSDIFS